MPTMPPPPPMDPHAESPQSDDNFAQLATGPPPWSKSAIIGFVSSLLICIPVVSSLVGIIAGIMGISSTSGGRRRGRGLAIAAIPISLLTGAVYAWTIMFGLATMANTLALQTTVERVFNARNLTDVDLQEWIDSSMSDQAADSTSPARIREWVEAVFADKGSIAEVPLTMRSEPGPVIATTVLIFPCRFVNGTADVRVICAVSIEKGVTYLIDDIKVGGHSLVDGP